MTNDVHYIAEKFLREHEDREKETERETNRIMDIEIQRIKEDNTYMTQRATLGMLQVILLKAEGAPYFCGFRKSDTSQPVWSYDIRFAKSIDHVQLSLWIDMFRARSITVLAIWNGVTNEAR